MSETWKPVVGFEGMYEIDDTGRVRNAKTGRILKPKFAGRGYVQLSLGQRNYRYVHRLVAQAFIANPHGYPQVNHRDGDKQNNAAANLEWCTAQMNLRHAYDSGLLDASACKKPVRGYAHSRSRPVEMSSSSGHIRIVYPSMQQAARELGIDYSTLYGAATGRFKQAGGWRWIFVSK